MSKPMIIAFAAVMMLAGCGEDPVAEQPQAAEETTTHAPEPEIATGTVIETDKALKEAEPGEPAGRAADSRTEEKKSDDAPAEPVTDRRPAEPAPSPKREEPQAPGPQPVATSKYDLATVDGKGLPAVTDVRPGCQIEVVSGHLTITGAAFELSTATREKCDGRVTAEDVWEASGEVHRDGTSIHFSGRSGEAFGSAEGTISQGLIVIRSISTEGGEETVDWRFREKG